MEATMVEAAPAEAPELRRVLGGAAGFFGLSLAGALGADAAVAPVGVWAGVGAVVLTGPALLVAHQFLGLRAAPDRVVGTLAEAVARAGALAAGLAPFQLFFSATTSRGPGFLALLIAGVGGAGLVWTGRHLLDAERAAGGAGLELARAHSLVIGWSALTLLVGLRLGLAVLR